MLLLANPILFTAALALGIAIGSLLIWAIQRFKLTHYKQLASEIIQKAELEGEAVKKAGELSLRQHQVEQQKEFERHWQTERRKIQNEEERLKQREDKLESRMSIIEKKLVELEKKETLLIERKAQLEEEKKGAAELQATLAQQLELLAGISVPEAKRLLFSQITEAIQSDAANYIKRSIKEAKERADEEAGKIIATAINRLAVSCTYQTTVNTVSIPNEEMKGRIIGREGRNIRSLERATGISFIIDDTPGAVVLSGFDPVRMHIAKMALTDLIQDGRIHPTSIEEAVEKARQNVQKLIKKYGEDAAMRAGCIGLHQELILLLGKLKFRFSYGQNILEHSLEVSHLMGMMASELGLDERLAKRIGLLHDVGKAVSQEMEGSHALVGHDLALKYGESSETANGIGCHHGEIEPSTVEASLCSAADAISASRQGARSENVEEYLKRLKKLEDIACEFPGVEKAHAMQAGREIRVVVIPDVLDDDAVVILARDLTKRIERDLSYPGKIKVTVIREKRVVEYAL